MAHEHKNCQEIMDHLYEYLSQHEITHEMAEEIEQHMALCRGCFDKMEFEKILLERLKAASACECPDSLRKRVHSLVAQY